LTESLGLAFEHIRALHATIAAVMTDVAALRRVVTKGSKASRGSRRELKIAMAAAKPLVATALRAYDEEIVRIECNGYWKN
jgi:hypothetical protein